MVSVRCACGCLLALVVASGVHGAEGPVSFRAVNQVPQVRRAVVGVSLPVPRGLLGGELPQSVFLGGRPEAVQVRAVTRWPDGSARRVMLRLPLQLEGDSRVDGQYPGGDVPAPPSAFERRGLRKGRFRTLLCDVEMEDDRIRLLEQRTGRELAELEPHGPGLTDPGEATWTVIEEGPFFVWIRYRRPAVNGCRETDVRIDCEANLRVTHRLQSRAPKDDWTPDFGVTFRAPGGRSSKTGTAPARFRGRDERVALASTDDLVVDCVLANGLRVSLAPPLALRQRRGTLAVDPLETDAGGVRVCLSRLEPVEDEGERLMIQDGQWRVTELVLSPGTTGDLAVQLDCPASAVADWRAYDAVYHTGEPLRLRHPTLREMAETAVFYLHRLSIDGDDWGNMTFYDPRTDTPRIDSFVRFNHCLYVWHDYFRTGDRRLFRIARDWSENYRDLSVYWGHERKHYGGSRRGRAYRDKKGSGAGPGTYMVRFNYALGFVTKGFHNFWLAFEETGDPRFREAAEAQATWAMDHVFCNRGEMRNVGVIADFAKLYEYTGRPEYLAHAVRLWEEFQSRQMPDLMFTQSGKKPTGNELYIPTDEFGYKHPFYKPYITQYATNALPYLLEHRPDDTRLRDTILACNRWMAGVQDAAGGWGYPAASTAGTSFSPEYCHGMLEACGADPLDELLDAVGRTLRSVVQLYRRHRIIPSGVNAWERVQGRSELLKTYRLAADRDRSRDFTHGQTRFGTSPDYASYVGVVLRDYLKHRDEASLFGPDPMVESLLSLPTTADSLVGRTYHPWARVAVTHSVGSDGMHVGFATRSPYASPGMRCRWRLPDGLAVDGHDAAMVCPRRGENRVEFTVTWGAESISRSVVFRAPVGPGDLGWDRWPAGIRIQAEEPAGQGGTESPVRLWHDRKGADGSAFSHWDAEGHWLEYCFETARAGEYLLLVKYACPHNALRTVALDGETLGTVRLANSGGYTLADRDDYSVTLLSDSDEVPRRITLAAGEHVLRLTNADGRGCNLDYLEWLPAE